VWLGEIAVGTHSRSGASRSLELVRLISVGRQIQRLRLGVGEATSFTPLSYSVSISAMKRFASLRWGQSPSPECRPRMMVWEFVRDAQIIAGAERLRAELAEGEARDAFGASAHE